MVALKSGIIQLVDDTTGFIDRIEKSNYGFHGVFPSGKLMAPPSERWVVMGIRSTVTASDRKV